MRRDIGGWQTRVDAPQSAAYRASGAWKGELIHEAAWARARTRPDAVALHFEAEKPATFGALAAEARLLAQGLSRLGLRPGQVVSYQLPNWREAAVINIAASAPGLVVNPIIPIYREAECLQILGDAGSQVLFIPDRFRGHAYPDMIDRIRGRLPGLIRVITVRPERDTGWSYDRLLERGRGHPIDWPEVDPDAVKLLLYTSGTTGKAKGVLHTYNTLAASRLDGVRYWGLGSGDVVFMPSPVTHITGYSLGIELPFVEDIQSALMVCWDAAAAVDYIDRVGGTVTVGATPFLQELIDAVERKASRLPFLRLFACGGAAVPPDLIRRGNAAFERCRCVRMYGSTEAPAVTRGWIGPEEAGLAAETDGRILGWDVAILGADGARAPAGEEGEIALRGPALTVGYADPVQNAGCFTEDGYFLTGDLGQVTPEGAILVTGRKKDLIIRGGENLSPKEIEDVLHRHPAIQEAAVVAMPHPRLGEGVCAYIVPRDPGLPPRFDAVLAFVADAGLARQKLPERIEIVPDLPRTASGKIRKDVLRTRIRETVNSERAGAPLA